MHLSQIAFQKILASLKCSSASYVPWQSSIVLVHNATNALKNPMAAMITKERILQKINNNNNNKKKKNEMVPEAFCSLPV